MHVNRKHNTVFYGWWVVGACSFIAMYTAGIIIYGFTAIFEPIAHEFGWSYAQISFAASLRGLETGLVAPLVGFLVDRWGARRLAFGGVAIIGLGLILFSRVTSLAMFYGVFFLIALGMTGCSGAAFLPAVANWFRRRVSFATGILLSGVGLGGLLVPLVAAFIDALEWRRAMVILGLSMWVIALPPSLLIRHKPEQYGYLPDGGVLDTVDIDDSPKSIPGAEVDIQPKEALKSQAFWRITLAFMGLSMMMSATMIHVMPYLSSLGIARSVSSLIASAMPVASIGGRVGFGWLGDRFNKKRVAAMGFILTGLGLLSFSYTGTVGIWLLLPSVILFGIGWGSNVTMRAALLREYFGRSRFGTIYGFTMGIMVLGDMAGPPLAGWVFDKWGSYQGIWFAFAVLALAAIFILLSAPSAGSTNR